MTSQMTPTFESELCWEYAPSVPSCDEHLGADGHVIAVLWMWKFNILQNGNLTVAPFETPSSWWSLFIIPKINDFWQKTHQRISENFWSFGFWHAVFTSDPWKLNDQWLGIICSIPMRFFKLLKIFLHFGGWLNWAISSFSWNVFVEIFENSLSPWRASRFPKGSREPARIGRRADPRPLKKLTWQYNISYCHIGSYESIET